MQEIARLLGSEDFAMGGFCTSLVFALFHIRAQSRKKDEERNRRAAVERGQLPR